ncbi:MAG TPA: ImcF-related family protein [Longimicrobiaceae bacterium]|nr:ImcF-related family protein [Longimicrobiaceae bacterium]
MTTIKIRLISAGVFFLFLAIAWAVGLVLGTGRTDVWILRSVLGALGIGASAIVYFFLRGRYRKDEGGERNPGSGDADIDVAIAAANARLGQSSATGGKKLRKLPLILVVGPSGSAKTSVVVHSGVEPELIAGEAEREGTAIPTGGVNIWYARARVLLEAGGGVLGQPGRWARVIKHMQPSRLAAVFSRGEQAPRMAVVCYPCDELLKPGNASSVPAAANELRERLAEVARGLGIQLPVYVLFTKADRLPYFEDFVRSMSRDEADEVLGATLPVAGAVDAGTFADREGARIRSALNEVLHSLALKRLDIMPRETRDEIRAGAYEFPREMRKISELATAFLVELCKPRQLGVSPFLRGFYFTGVRPVFLGDVAAERSPARPAAPQITLGATSVFNPELMRAAEAAANPAPAASGGGRKVPDWTFLKGVFRDIIFLDTNAMALTAGGTRVNLLRRTLLVSAATMFLLLSGAHAVSYANNRALTRDSIAAARAVEGLAPAGGELASLEALQRLDELREQTQRLRQHQIDGRPLRFGWGLYSGSALLPQLRRLYFDRFDRVLWQRTRSELVGSLRMLPDTPTESSEYGATYDMLKAHLITTSHPFESTADFLAPALLTQWRKGFEPEEERSELARRHFAFFGEELPFGNPYDAEADEALVARTRVLLHGFGNVDQFYQVMISAASAETPAIQFDREFPGTENVVQNSYVVAGAFTKPGWEWVQGSLSNLDQLFSREDWVVGDRAISAQDRVTLARDLRARYLADYIGHWRQYLAATSIARASNLPEASRLLGRLSANDSPVLQLMALAARNTDVDSAVIARVFQPVHEVTPPAITDRYVSEANAPYIAALGGLQSSLTQASAAPPQAREAASLLVVSDADRVRSEIRTLAQKFSIEGEAQAVGATVQALLQAPATGVEPLVGGLAASGANQGGAGFCQVLRPVMAKFPFNPRATTDATMDEVSAVFQRGSSALTAFHEGTLQELVIRQGPRFAARVGASPQPTAQFLAFFNRAMEISEALYDERGAGPEVSFLLRAQTTDDLPEVTINIDGQAQTFTRTFSSARPFTWQGARASSIAISGTVNGRDTSLLEARGPWAVFRLFQAANWESLGGDRYMLRWQAPGGQSVAAELTMGSGAPPIFRSDYLGQLGCVAQVAR